MLHCMVGLLKNPLSTCHSGCQKGNSQHTSSKSLKLLGAQKNYIFTIYLVQCILVKLIFKEINEIINKQIFQKGCTE